MLVKIGAYRSNSHKDGETIRLLILDTLLLMCIDDVDDLIANLQEAKEYALNAEVGDEVLELSFEL